MALSADQKAMLELLLGGQSYDDLADLFGMDESEVRLRARTALAALGGSDPDKKVPLADYLLGKADPIDRADAVRHLKEDPDEHAMAKRILDGLAEIAPDAELVKLPGEPGGGRFMRKSPATPAAAGTATPSASVGGAGSPPGGLDSRQKRLIGILAGGAVILIAIVLGVTGAFSGSDSSDSGDVSSADTSDVANSTDASGGDTATIPLRGSGNKASGQAIIGVASGDQAYVDISIKGLPPAPKGSAYVIWMLLAKNQGYPLAPIQTDKNGNYENRFPIDSQVLPVVARVQNVNVSLAKISDIEAEIKKAATKGSPVIPRIGKTVLDGPVPKSAQTTEPLPTTSTPDAGTSSTPSSTTTTPSTTTPDTTTGG